MRNLLFVAFIFLNIQNMYSQEVKPEIKFINIANAPLTINQVGAAYYYENFQAGIKCFVKSKITSQKKIIGFAYDVVFYSIFNDFLGWKRGANIKIIKPGEEYKYEWVSTDVPSAFLYHTAIFYPAAFRFEDGEVWKVNIEDVKNEIKKINPGFDLTFFDKK